MVSVLAKQCLALLLLTISFTLEWVESQLSIIQKNAIDTLGELDNIINGDNPRLEATFTGLLHDADSKSKIRKLRHNLRTQYDVILESTSSSHVDTWLQKEAKDGVVRELTRCINGY